MLKQIISGFWETPVKGLHSPHVDVIENLIRTNEPLTELPDPEAHAQASRGIHFLFGNSGNEVYLKMAYLVAVTMGHNHTILKPQ